MHTRVHVSMLACTCTAGKFLTDRAWMWISGFSGLSIIILGVAVSSFEKMPWEKRKLSQVVPSAP